MPDLSHWSPPPRPPHEPLAGRTCRLEPLDPARHGDSLVAAHAQDPTGRGWTYLHAEAPTSPVEVAAWVAHEAQLPDRLAFALVDPATGRATGSLTYMAIVEGFGTIEIGSVLFSPELQRTTAATEAVYLLASRAFELGYRRLEWKCDARNQASRRAAERFGFTYEGCFRQHHVVKGRNRDTAWLSIIGQRVASLAPDLRGLARARELRPGRKPAGQSARVAGEPARALSFGSDTQRGFLSHHSLSSP